MSDPIVEAFNGAATWDAVLTAIRSNDEALLDPTRIQNLGYLADDAEREQAVRLGVNEIKALFGNFTSLSEIRAVVERQIDVEYAKYEFVFAFRNANTVDDMRVALDRVQLLHNDRESIIQEWSSNSDPAVRQRATELAAEPYTIVLRKIAVHLSDGSYLDALATELMSVQQENGPFDTLGNLIEALDSATDVLGPDSLVSAFNDAAGWEVMLAAIKDHATALLDHDHLAKLNDLADNQNREQAIGLGILEIKNLFGDYVEASDVKTAVEHQIDVEHAKFKFITELDEATTASEMTAAIKATIRLVNDHRQALITAWSQSNLPAVVARAEALADTAFTKVLAEIVNHLNDATYMAELGARMLAARDVLDGKKFFDDGNIITALDASDQAIEATHDASISGTSTGALTEDGPQNTTSGTLSVADEDWGENVFQAVTAADLQKQYGTFTFNETTGVWSFTVNGTAGQSLRKDQMVQQTLTVRSADGTDSETITVTIAGANDGPVAASNGNDISGNEDTTITGTLPAGSDVDGDGLTYELVAPVAGLTLNADGTFRYMPAADANGVVEFQYRVVDAAGAKSAPQTFRLTVTAVNDAPRDILLSKHSVLENSAAGTEIGKLTASDPEGGAFTYTLLNNASGRFVIDANGSLRVASAYAFDYEQAKSHTIRVQVKDSAGKTYEETFTIDVTDDTSESVTGTAGADVLVGGAGKDVFKGGSGNDTLTGGDGNDMLWGDKGKDVFVFGSKLGTSSTDRKVNFDTIKDFSVKDDCLYLDNAIFRKLGSDTPNNPKQLSKSLFTIGDKAKDKNDYVIYNDKTGVLSYDADGSGRGKAVEFAELSKKLPMTHKDFFVI